MLDFTATSKTDKIELIANYFSLLKNIYQNISPRDSNLDIYIKRESCSFSAWLNLKAILREKLLFFNLNLHFE